MAGGDLVRDCSGFSFVAAALLGIGNDGIASAGGVRTGAVSYPEESREGNAATGVVLYLLRLGISVAGVVLIVGGFALVVILLQKLGVHGQKAGPTKANRTQAEQEKVEKQFLRG